MRWLGVFCVLLLGSAAHAASDDEIPLFDFKGRPTAYIAEEMTIYLWDGRPVAYLDRDESRDGLSASTAAMSRRSVEKRIAVSEE
jgi:hypothetical protein